MPKKKFWSFKTLADNSAALYLYGAIGEDTWLGDEISPNLFRQELEALGPITALDVYINSPGGDAFAGIAIYNLLKRCNAEVTTHVDGLAASAASIVFMAGKRRCCAKSGTVMVHEAWCSCCGNKHDLQALAEQLDVLDGQLAGIYADESGMSIDDATAMMVAETWMDGTDAVARGLATETEEDKQMAACADTAAFFARYKHPPAAPLPENKGAGEPGKTAEVQGPAGEPVADKDPLLEQRRYFASLKRKIFEGTENA